MKQPVIRTVTATEAKNRFGELLKGAYLRSEHLIVERDGIPVAVIVPIQDYNALTPASGEPPKQDAVKEEDRRRARAAADMREFLDRLQATRPVYPEEEVQRDIEQAIRAVRGQ